MALGLQLSDVFPLMPKFQKQLSGKPVEVLEKVTYNGAHPLLVLKLKLAVSWANKFPDSNKKLLQNRIEYKLLLEDWESLRVKRGNKNIGHGVLMLLQY